MTLAFLAVLAIGLAGGCQLMRGLVRSEVAGMQRIASPEGVATAGYETIGGVRQWVTVRGQDRRQPLLVYLHGGPGGATSDIAYAFQKPWEDYFTVVQWDQRGFGRSAVDIDKMAPVTKEQLVSDTIELIEKLRRRYHQPKVILVGHSWGSVLGATVAARRPDLLYAYVGMGQVVGWESGVLFSRDAQLARARAAGDTAWIEQLKAAGAPPPSTDVKASLAWIDKVQAPLAAHGASWHNVAGSGDLARRMLAIVLSSDTLSAGDIVHRLTSSHADKTMYPLVRSISGWEFRRDVGTRFETPVIFISGRHDLQTPVELVTRLEGEVCAPYKKMVLLDHSAHYLVLEEPGRLLEALTSQALPFAQGARPAGPAEPACPKR